MSGNNQGNAPLVFLDLETTGLRPGIEPWHDRVCEIAALRFDPTGETDRLVTLINPQRPIPAEAAAIHHISDDMVQTAPCFGDIIPMINRVVDGGTLVIHNAPFDLGFLRAEFRRFGLEWIERPVVDTLVIARRQIPTVSHSLPNLATLLGVSPGGHRALGDVLTMKAVFERLRLGEVQNARGPIPRRSSSYQP